MHTPFVEYQKGRTLEVVPVGRAGIDLNTQTLNVPFKDNRLYAKTVGGSPANIAQGAARLGVRTGFIGKVSGNGMGDYGIKEITCPSRTLTSTVKICGGTLCRLPVVTDGEIPKQKLFDAMSELNHVEAQAPVQTGDVILSNIAGTGVALVASRSITHI